MQLMIVLTCVEKSCKSCVKREVQSESHWLYFAGCSKNVLFIQTQCFIIVLCPVLLIVLVTVLLSIYTVRTSSTLLMPAVQAHNCTLCVSSRA
jgi:hypothetical protein